MGRETSEKCDQDNVIKNLFSIQARRMMTEQRIDGLERKASRKTRVIHKNFEKVEQCSISKARKSNTRRMWERISISEI